MENKKFFEKYHFVILIANLIIWDTMIFPKDGSYVINGINMNLMAEIMIFTIVFASVFYMLKDYRLTLISSICSMILLLQYSNMMYSLSSLIVLITMWITAQKSYLNYSTNQLCKNKENKE